MQICYILYPGDDSLEGKILRLKQQYTLCSASLQDIIVRFEKRSGSSINWEEFPNKVAVQMNDTHPTLCIPELMRILIDVKGLNWDQAWKITQRYLPRFSCSSEDHDSFYFSTSRNFQEELSETFFINKD